MKHLPGLWFIIKDIDDPICTYRAYNANETLMTAWSRTTGNLLDNTDDLLTYSKACVKNYTPLQNIVIINSEFYAIEQAKETYPELFI